jgi:uncharacterized protein
LSELEETGADGEDSSPGDRTGAAGPSGQSSGEIAASVLDYVAKAIVDEPDAVVVESEAGRNGPTLRLHVAQGDMGKVIGRRGRVAQAIRALVRAAGSRDGTDVQFNIVD